MYRQNRRSLGMISLWVSLMLVFGLLTGAGCSRSVPGDTTGTGAVTATFGTDPAGTLTPAETPGAASSQSLTTTTRTTSPASSDPATPVPSTSGSESGPALTSATPTTRPASATPHASVSEPVSVNAVVGLARGTKHASVTASAIARAGGLDAIIKRGDTVLIKPNLCWSTITDRPVNTDVRVVAELVRQARELGAAEIIIAEGPFGPECFTESSLAKNKYNTLSDVTFVSLNTISKEDCYYRTGDNSVTGKPMYIPKIYVDADVVITVAKMKTHNAGMVTLGLKNAFGVPPRGIYGTSGSLSGSKLLLHSEFDFNAAIVEINLIRRPDFVVIDGIVAGEGEGPLRNAPVDARIILAGRDIVAVDTVAAIFMGFKPEKIPHIALAAEAGLGEGDISRIKVVGGVLADLVIDFKSVFPKN